MTPAIFVGKTYNALRDFMEAYEELKSLNESLVDLGGTTYTTDYFATGDHPITNAEFGNIFNNLADDTGSYANIFAAIENSGTLLNKARSS